jgi:hypothetical protein
LSLEILEKIEKLSELKDKSIITEKEFEDKKKFLLEKLTKSEKILRNEKIEGSLWLPIPSFIFGIIGLLATFDDSEWTIDEEIGIYFFIFMSLLLGIISVSIQKEGKGMAIAGIILSALAVLVILGN